MVCRKRIPRFVGGAQCLRERIHASRSRRSWTTWLYSYTSWTTAERQALGSSFECWWAPTASSTATRICRCIKTAWKMQDAHLAEEQTLIPIHPQHQQRQRQDQQFEGGNNLDYCVDRKTGWRYYREPRGNPPAASSSSTSTSQWPTSQWQTSESSWQPTSSEKW